jgi:hypothetical protein
MDSTRGRTYSEDYRNNIFYKVDLSHTNFNGANLDGVKFIKCVLYNTDFRGAKITHRTKIDYTGMRSPLEAGARFTERQKVLLRLPELARERGVGR